jgi:hypothetical protein
MQSQEAMLSNILETAAKVYDLSERHCRFATASLGTIDETMQELESPDTDLLEQTIIEEKRFNLKLKELCTEVIAYSAQIRELYNDINKPHADVVAIGKKIATISPKQDEIVENIVKIIYQGQYRQPEAKKCCCCSIM